MNGMLSSRSGKVAQLDEVGKDKQAALCTAICTDFGYTPFCSAPEHNKLAWRRLCAAELWWELVANQCSGGACWLDSSLAKWICF